MPLCKIFALTNASKVNFDSKFINIVKSQVCKTNDRDGFGYAVLRDSGLIHGERTTNPELFEPLRVSGVTAALPCIEVTRNSFGSIDDTKLKSFIGHGRFSTNTRSIENTHPFFDGNAALIHNGVVRHIGPKIESLKTDCDTELLAHHWGQSQMQGIEDSITGYYAMAILEHGMLHIVKDSIASLYVAWSPSIESFIIATTQDIIQGVAKEMGWVIEPCEAIADNSHTVFDGNSVVSCDEIYPLEIDNGPIDSKTRVALGMGRDYDEPLPGDSEEYFSDANTLGYERESIRYSDLNDDDGPAYREDYSAVREYMKSRKVG